MVICATNSNTGHSAIRQVELICSNGNVVLVRVHIPRKMLCKSQVCMYLLRLVDGSNISEAAVPSMHMRCLQNIP
jgi:hypothetical protein